jgi:microcystin-dependent protein
MAWKWFSFLHVATEGTLPTLDEASPAWTKDTKHLHIHDGTDFQKVPFFQDFAGFIAPFAGSLAPDGWLECDGSAVSRTTYALLYSKISTTWGAGDGSTTFNLPDLRETALVGIGTRGSGVTAHDTYTIGQFKDDQMQGHLHSLNTIYATQGSPGGNSITGSSTTADQDLPSSGSMISDGVNGTPRKGTTTHGKQAGVLYCIKY